MFYTHLFFYIILDRFPCLTINFNAWWKWWTYINPRKYFFVNIQYFVLNIYIYIYKKYMPFPAPEGPSATCLIGILPTIVYLFCLTLYSFSLIGLISGIFSIVYMYILRYIFLIVLTFGPYTYTTNNGPT